MNAGQKKREMAATTYICFVVLVGAQACRAVRGRDAEPVQQVRQVDRPYARDTAQLLQCVQIDLAAEKKQQQKAKRRDRMSTGENPSGENPCAVGQGKECPGNGSKRRGKSLGKPWNWHEKVWESGGKGGRKGERFGTGRKGACSERAVTGSEY